MKFNKSKRRRSASWTLIGLYDSYLCCIWTQKKTKIKKFIKFINFINFLWVFFSSGRDGRTWILLFWKINQEWNKKEDQFIHSSCVCFCFNYTVQTFFSWVICENYHFHATPLRHLLNDDPLSVNFSLNVQMTRVVVLSHRQCNLSDGFLFLIKMQSERRQKNLKLTRESESNSLKLKKKFSTLSKRRRRNNSRELSSRRYEISHGS